MLVRRSRQSGFTLIESLVVVALVAILAAVAAPSMTGFIATMQTKGAAFDLIGDMTLARSEAIKRNAEVKVKAVGNDWAKGWTLETGGAAFRSRGALPSSVSITATQTSVIFRPNGRLSENDTITSGLSWSLTSSRKDVLPRCVVITPTGTARSKGGACS